MAFIPRFNLRGGEQFGGGLPTFNVAGNQLSIPPQFLPPPQLAPIQQFAPQQPIAQAQPVPQQFTPPVNVSPVAGVTPQAPPQPAATQIQPRFNQISGEQFGGALSLGGDLGGASISLPTQPPQQAQPAFGVTGSPALNPPPAQQIQPQQGQIEPAFRQPGADFNPNLPITAGPTSAAGVPTVGDPGAVVSQFQDVGGPQAGLPQVTVPQVQSQALPGGAPPTGLIGAEQALLGGATGATGAVLEGQTQAQQFLQQGQQQALGGLQGFIDPGLQAQQQLAALSGLGTPEEREAAFANLQESPGQRFLREEQEKATIRSFEARGGVGGGNVRRELARQAAGRAAGIEQQQRQGLAQLGGQGLQAASQAANIEQTTGINLAQLAQQTGTSVADIVTDASRGVAGARTQAGRDIATAISGASAQLGELQAGQGRGISDIVGSQVGNIGKLLLNQGLSTAQAQEQQATILANLATGQGSQAANIASNIGLVNSAGILGQSSNIQSIITTLGKEFGKSDFLNDLLQKQRA